MLSPKSTTIEEWRKVFGFENYSVSSLGRLRRDIGGPGSTAGRVMKFKPKKSGYLVTSISLNGVLKNILLHRLVAFAFIPNPHNKPQVNHKNGIKADNQVNNLEWATPQENGKHAALSGLYTSGDLHYARLHPEKMARGTRHGSKTHPERIARGLKNGAYTHPEKIRRGKLNGNSKLTLAQILSIRRQVHKGANKKELASQYGIHWSSVYKIANREAWAHVPLKLSGRL